LLTFHPQDFGGAQLPPLHRPKFLAIIASDVLAITLVRKANGRVDGFVIEGPTAGGHNAPPRGKLQLNERGEPIYGERDQVDLAKVRELGLPFWLAGGFGRPEKLREALRIGAAGIQVGTPFALCDESGLRKDLKQALIARAIAGTARVFTDPLASPTGYPLKVAELEGTLSQEAVYGDRPRICDMGYLREAYRTPAGDLGYRCPAEPISAYLHKGGTAESTVGRKCVCNGLFATIGLGQLRGNELTETSLVTAGDDLEGVARFLEPGQTRYGALDVIAKLLPPDLHLMGQNLTENLKCQNMSPTNTLATISDYGSTRDLKGPGREPRPSLMATSSNPVLGDIKTSYNDYGCKVNQVSPDELFELYTKAGFLYPQKLQKLAPFLPLVKENWRKAFRAGELLLCCITTASNKAEDWATGATWRCTTRGLQAQHLVSIGSPAGSRAVLLAPQAVVIDDGYDNSCQNWYRPENRFPARVFGTLVDTIGPANSRVNTYNLFALPKRVDYHGDKISVAPDSRNGKSSGLYTLAAQVRGRVYAEAEELGQEDILLDSLDQLYARVGLRRYRRIWLARMPGHEMPVGAAIAYRGPLGLNFSFLENRCDLILSPDLADDQIPSVALPLLAAVATAYEDFLPDMIPVVTESSAVPCLRKAGAQLIRQYCQSIWLRGGFVGWYRHIDHFYDRMREAQRRYGLGRHSTATTIAATKDAPASEPSLASPKL
jgi:NAD(P)H-dependent flavin oxidoreductase YrpB (nitropropane dioxygenase family)